MRYDSYLSKIEDLEIWFQINNTGDTGGKLSRPYFTVYRGTEAKADRIIYRNEEISDKSEAWEMLERIITAHSDGGGIFRVLIVHEPKHNVGLTTILKVPNPNPMTAQGIHGTGQTGNFGIYGSFREALETELARERKLMEMERELDDLKQGQAALNGLETFKDLVQSVPALNNLIHVFGLKMMGMGQQVPPPAPIHYPGAPAADTAIHGSDTEEGFDYETVEPALDKLRRVFPDVETKLARFAEWAERNPELAKTMLNNTTGQ